jgi:lysophospholipase L1-like esterase
VLVIGDSLQVGTGPYLEQQLGAMPVELDSRESRGSGEGLEALRARLRPDHTVVVFDMGTNDDPSDADALFATLQAVRAATGDRCLVVATLLRPPYNGITYDELNAALERFAIDTPGVQLVDWYGVATSTPGILYDDGVHARPEGYALRGRLIADAVRSCDGGGGGGSGIPVPSQPAASPPAVVLTPEPAPEVEVRLEPPAPLLRAQLAAHRERTSRPVAVNVLLPFARREHWEVAVEADAVVTFWGAPERVTDGIWVHQCGSVDEAQAAVRAGADAVIVQGLEAGGHVRGELPALDLLGATKARLPPGFPIWLAGGVAERADVEAALGGGADAVVAGTRFLLSEESDAHPEYKRRLLDARETFVTELFGAGWPAPHRVVANGATDRWLGDGRRGPGWVRALHRATAPALSRLREPAIALGAEPVPARELLRRLKAAGLRRRPVR